MGEGCSVVVEWDMAVRFFQLERINSVSRILILTNAGGTSQAIVYFYQVC